MSIKTSMDVHGLKELDWALKQLPKELVGKNGGPVRTALMGAALPMFQVMQRQIASKWKDEGELLKTVGRKRHKNPKKVNELISVGVQGKRGPKKDASGRSFLSPYWLEFGTHRMQADPIIGPAFNSNKEEAVKIFRTRLAGGIVKIAKKINNENVRKVAAQVRRL